MVVRVKAGHNIHSNARPPKIEKEIIVLSTYKFIVKKI